MNQNLEIIVETKRLRLYPISNEAMKHLIETENDVIMQEAYSEMLQGCIDHPEQRIWYAIWLMELKDQPGTIVGDFCFKGLNEDGMVEIGYGLRDGYCGCGYMTETVKTISTWALAQPGVTRIEAETEATNLASQKVLANAAYTPTGSLGDEGPRFVLHKSSAQQR